MSFSSCVEKPKLNWRQSCFKKEVRKKILWEGKKKFVVSLSTRRFGRYWRSFIPRSSIAGFLPFLPLFFSVVVDSWLTPRGLGPHVGAPVSLTLSFSGVFFLKQLEPFWWGRLVMVCRMSRMLEKKEFEIVAYVLWFVCRMSSQVCHCLG